MSTPDYIAIADEAFYDGMRVSGGLIRHFEENNEWIRDNLAPVSSRAFLVRTEATTGGAGGDPLATTVPTLYSARWKPWGPIPVYVPPEMFTLSGRNPPTLVLRMYAAASSDEIGAKVAAYSVQATPELNETLPQQDFDASENWTDEVTSSTAGTVSLSDIAVVPGWNDIVICHKSNVETSGGDLVSVRKIEQGRELVDDVTSDLFDFLLNAQWNGIEVLTPDTDEIEEPLPRLWVALNDAPDTVDLAQDDAVLFTVVHVDDKGAAGSASSKTRQYVRVGEVNDWQAEGLDSSVRPDRTLHFGKLGVVAIRSITADLATQEREFAGSAAARWRQTAGNAAALVAAQTRRLHQLRLGQLGMLTEQGSYNDAEPEWWRVQPMTRNDTLSETSLGAYIVRTNQGDLDVYDHKLEMRVQYAVVYEVFRATTGRARLHLEADRLDGSDTETATIDVPLTGGVLRSAPLTALWVYQNRVHGAHAFDGVHDWDDVTGFWAEAIVELDRADLDDDALYRVKLSVSVQSGAEPDESCIFVRGSMGLRYRPVF